MYEEVKVELIFLQSEDVVRTSPTSEWKDENVDEGGWV